MTDELTAGFAALTGSLTAARRQIEAEPTSGGPVGAASERAGLVPVTLLTGFLGSGKTTVVRELLTGDHGLQVTAIVNDLAAVNVDARSLASTRTGGADQIAQLELSNGCACCELTDDLLASLAAAAQADDASAAARRPDAIVVEASGAADPVTVAAAIDGAPGVCLDGVVAVVDVQAIGDQLAHPVVGRLARRQLEAAHLLLLSKVDLVEPQAIADATAMVADVAPGRVVLPAEHGAVDPAVLLSAAARGAVLPVDGPSSTLSLATGAFTPSRIDLRQLADWLEGEHGLVRAKGWVAETDGRLHELQVVGRRWSLTPTNEVQEPTVVVHRYQRRTGRTGKASLRRVHVLIAQTGDRRPG